MNMSQKKTCGTGPPNADPVGAALQVPVGERGNYVCCGAVLGFVSGLLTLLAVGAYYGLATGLGAGSSVGLGLFFMVALSHPAGLLGMTVGALCGLLCTWVARLVGRSRSFE